jgi:nitrous oxidase accessory protein NosD
MRPRLDRSAARFRLGMALLTLLGSLFLASPAAAKTLQAASAEDLLNNLQAAEAGDVVLLAPGSYGAVTIRRIKRPGAVTIASGQDNARATFTSLTLQECSNLVVRGVDIAVAPETTGLKVLSSEKIALDRLVIHGSPAPDAVGAGQGVLVRNSVDVSVSQTEFHHLINALAHLDNDGLTITRNLFHDLRVDGVRGGGSSRVTISHNAFWNFFRAPKDHPDAIQFWTTNTTASARSIEIVGNLIMRGEGGPMQGIFIGDESKGKYPFYDLKVRDNIIVGSMFHGLSLYQVRDVTVRKNIVLGYKDMGAWLRLAAADRAIVEDNETTSLKLGEENGELRKARNRVISPAKPSDRSALKRWFAAHGADLAPLPPGAAALLQ